VKWKVVITDAAANDILEAKEWYESRQTELGWKFWQYVQLALRNVQRSPRLGAASGKRNFRKRNLLIFPYSVYYELAGDEIRIHAVWHGARSPKILKKRLS